MIMCKKFMGRENIATHITEYFADHPDAEVTNVITTIKGDLLVFFQEKEAIVKLKKELEAVNELLFDIFNHACQSRYDHTTKTYFYSVYNDFEISSYSEVMEYLVKIGKITKDQCE